ncbi:SNF2 family N-terminal domain-containing protein [Trichoderma velutinum]
MEPVDDPYRHEAKRRRLDTCQSSDASSFVERTEGPDDWSPAGYDPAFALSIAHLPVSTGALPTWLPAQYHISVGLEDQNILPMTTNLHAPPNHLISQSHETLDLNGVGSFDIQFAANEHPCGFPNSALWTNPLSHVPMESLAVSNFYQVPEQLLQAELHALAQAPYELYPTSSYQPPVISEQSSKSLPTAVWVDIVQKPDEIEVSQPSPDQGGIVCFGMISGVSGRCERRISEKDQSVYEVQLNSSASFCAIDNPLMKGMILSDHGQMIQGLLDEPAINLFASCTPHGELSTRKTLKCSSQISCVLDITVYGPWELFEQIGIWFQEYGAYLQDPRVCHMNVKYCNPHRLSSEDFESCLLLSQVVSHTNASSCLQDITEGPELLDILSSNVDLEETPQPKAIRAILQSHQKKALTFLLRREKGWAFDGHQSDIWEKVDTDQGRFFVNRVSAAHQTEEPPQFYGGIIADPMGLGKTLTMISLAATDLESDMNNELHMEIDDEKANAVPATLIIVPPPLLGTWEDQLAEHVVQGSMEWRCHYGKNRFVDKNELNSVNVVLTTYHTVSAEWKTGNSILFSVRWRRIVLDEAHYIRNGNSRMAHSICALDSVARWAVTGTPIQNRLADLATLLRFIRAHPYTDPKVFDTDISRFWKSGKDEEAVRRLKHLSACLLLRRPKATINLPQRRDMRCPVDFSREERALYDEIREQAVSKIEEVLQNNSEASRAGGYVNVLQQIESLRLVCDLGLYYHSRHQNLQHLMAEATDWASVAQETFNVQRGMGPMVCAQCSSTLELTETLFDDSTSVNTSPEFSRCLRYVCGDCIHKLGRANHIALCRHKPSCPTAPVSISTSVFEDVSSLISPQIKNLPTGIPSKVKALITDIKSLPPDAKCVVFSTWRLTLDVIEAGLDQGSLSSIRFDGKVPQKDRQSVIEKFKTDPNLRVMLLTLSCGAVGLTLTVASRAYLMEPHWNPTLEEQALARIHRIGQTREVTTVRFYMRDSFEEQVMEVQESKKNLAGVLLSLHDGGRMDDSIGTLQVSDWDTALLKNSLLMHP